MPERPGKLGKAVQKIDDRLPITFRFYTGAGIPPVGYDEAVFTEDTSQNADGVGKLYFRRRGRIHVIEAGFSFIPTNPPAANPGFFLLDDEYLFWASNTSYTASQRSAGIRWAVAAATPDRFEFDTGHAASNASTRHYITQFASGTDASLAISAFRYVLSDSTTYSTNPSTTTYRGLALEGSLAIAVPAGSGSGSNLITNGTFSSWSGTDYPTSWWVKGGTSQQTGRDGTGFCVQVNTSATSPGNTDSTLVTRTPGGDDRLGNPLGNCYIQLNKNKLYSWTFYVLMASVETTRQLGLRIAAFAANTDTSPTYSLLAGGQGFPGGTSVSFALTGLPWAVGDNQFNLTSWPNDSTWRQVTITFDTTLVGAGVGDPFFADIRFYGDPRDNISFWRFDDVTLSLASTSITAPTTVVGISETQFAFVPTTTGSGDTLALTSLVGINATPSIAPSVAAGGSVTLASAYGVLAGLAYTAPTGTFTLTDAYSIYADVPGVGTNKYAGWFNGVLAVGNGSELRLYKSGSSTIYSGFTAGAQGSTIQYTLPTAQGASNTVLLNNGSGTLSWSAVSAVAYVQVQEEGVNLTQRGTINFIGAAITAADDAGNSRTNVTLSQSPASASVVGTGRTLTGTAPIRIDGGASGDLSADRTISVTSAALTRVDDTNVTLTLGGSPSTALLAATSLTLGWAGQLAISRGGTSASTALGAFNALSPLTTRGDLLTRDASNNVRLAIGASGRILRSDGTDPAWATLSTAGIVAGSGTLNTIPKWTPDGVTLGDSSILDNGTDVRFIGVGDIKLDIIGNVISSTNLHVSTPGAYELGEAGSHWQSLYVGSIWGPSSPGDALNNYSSADDGTIAMTWQTTVTHTSGPLYSFQNRTSERFAIDFNGNLTIGGGTTAATAKWLEPSGSGTNFTGLKAQAQSADITYTFPATSAVGVLHNDGSSVWSWSAVSLTADITDTLAIGNGGTGQTTALAAFNALSPLTTRGDLLTRDASNNVRLAVGASGRILRSDGTDPSWVTLATAGIVAGTGTTNTITKWTSTSGALGDSTLSDDGSIVTTSTGSFKSSVAAATTGWLFNTTNTLSATLFDFQNNTSTRFKADFGGVITQTVSETVSSSTRGYTLTNGLTANANSLTLSGFVVSGTLNNNSKTSGSLVAYEWNSAMTNCGSSTISVTGFNLSPGFIGTTTVGNVTVVFAKAPTISSGTLTSSSYIALRAGSALAGTCPTVVGVQDVPGDAGLDITRSSYGAGFVSKAGTWSNGLGASTMPDWYGLLVEDQAFSTAGDNFSTVPRKHGFSIAMDSDFVDNGESGAAPILAWLATRSTAIASRRGGITVTTSSVMNFDISATNVLTLSSTAATLTDAINVVVGSTTGTKIATATTQKLGFYNATPIAQRSGAAQVAVATTAATNVAPFGYTTQAQADAIVTLVNELRAWAVAQGFIKGSA